MDASPGISFIFNLKLGDDVVISGPFGEFFAKETDAEMVFAEAALHGTDALSHLHQFRRIKTDRKVSLYGARSSRGVLTRISTKSAMIMTLNASALSV